MWTEIRGTRVNLGEQQQVVDWRRGRLLDAGFGYELADALANEFRVDLHALLQLVERGCPPLLATRILAPADGEEFVDE
jgi:hypothetical protein